MSYKSLGTRRLRVPLHRFEVLPCLLFLHFCYWLSLYIFHLYATGLYATLRLKEACTTGKRMELLKFGEAHLFLPQHLYNGVWRGTIRVIKMLNITHAIPYFLCRLHLHIIDVLLLKFDTNSHIICRTIYIDFSPQPMLYCVYK